MSIIPWSTSSNPEKAENEFSQLWSELEELERDMEDQEIELDDVEEFGDIATEDFESGFFFKPRETHKIFEKRVSEEELRQYGQSGLISEIDFGDHKNFFFVTDRGEYAIENFSKIAENRELYEELLQEEGESFWELGETDRKIQEGPVAHRGDTENDYTVKEDRGGFLTGGWEKVLTEKGQRVKNKAEKYEQRILRQLVDSSPHPDPEKINPIETILVNGTSRISERIQLVEGFMSEKRKSYVQEFVENSGDGHQGYARVGEKMLEEWSGVVNHLEERRENLVTESGEITDEGTDYIDVAEEKLGELEKSLVYLRDETFDPSEGDIEKVKQKLLSLEKLYSDEFTY